MIFIYILFYCFPLINSWTAHSHLIISTIARQQLQPNEIIKIETLLSTWSDFPTMNDLVNASLWMNSVYCLNCDGIDKDGLFKEWNWWRQTINPLNISIPNSSIDRSSNNTILALLNNMQKLLPYFKTNWEWNFAIRLALHLIADLHQPLYCAQLFTPKLPDGDLGGNRILMSNGMTLTEFWDGAGGLFTLDADDVDWDDLSLNASIIQDQSSMGSFNKQLSDILDFNYSSWAQESSEVASKMAYDFDLYSITPLQVGTLYTTQTQRVATRQMALAGYRLGLWLKNSFQLINKLKLNTTLKCPDNRNTTTTKPMDVDYSVAPIALTLVMGAITFFYFYFESI